MPVRVQSLHTYPVKSCKGIDLPKAAVTHTGLLFDRHWCIITADRGNFVTQRTIPTLSLVATHLPAEALVLRRASEISSLTDAEASAALTLSFPGQSDMRVPIANSAGDSSNAALAEAKVWEWQGRVLDEGDEVAEWLSDALRQRVRLVRHLSLAPDALNGAATGASGRQAGRRQADPEFAPGTKVTFADGFPLTLASEASRRAVEAQCSKPVEMQRFRPNIVVEGDDLQPFDEDYWQSFAAGTSHDGAALQMQSVKPCSRCSVTNVQQNTGKMTPETLQTLFEMRRGRQLADKVAVFRERPEFENGAFFTWNCTADAEGTISVGDEVTVAQRRS